MNRWIGWAAIAAMLVVLALGGCGNVCLRGEALTAAESSAMDAYGAAERATSQPAVPAWAKSYLDENYLQWRWFVRSARNDLTWGPKLEGE